MSKLKDKIVKVNVFHSTLPSNEWNSDPKYKDMYKDRPFYVTLGTIDYILVDSEKTQFDAVLGTKQEIIIHKAVLQNKIFRDLLETFVEIPAGLDGRPGKKVYINPDNVVYIWLHGDQANFEMKYSGHNLPTTRLNWPGSLEVWLGAHFDFEDLTSKTGEDGIIRQP